MKKIIIKLAIQNGEYRHTVHCLHTTSAKSIGLAAQRFAAGYYGGEAIRDGEWWSFYCGEIAIKVENVHEIEEKDVDILTYYLT